jgi:DnaD/phage-associated family protein
MAISINLGAWGSVFAVPTCIADEHIKIASEQQLKVILFLLRNSEKMFTYEDISKALGIHSEDVKDCVNFWIERGVICENNNVLAPAQGEVNKTVEPAVQTPQPVKKTPVPRAIKPDIVTAAQRVSADEHLQMVLSEVEIALSKPLSSGDTATIVMLYDTCGLPAEVIIMLVNYCVSINKGNMRTIERIGVQWADAGIHDIESAENRIMQIKQSNANWSFVSGVFGMKNVGSPTKKQLEYANLWVGQWHFSEEMLRSAYEACVDNVGKVNMQYINKILQRWNNAGIFVVEDIAKLDKKKPTKKSGNASYDIEELEKIQ